MNPLYLLLFIPAIGAWVARDKVRKAYDRHSKTPTRAGLTGVEVAQRLLDYHGLTGVTVETTPGTLTDHYDLDARVLRLSEGIAEADSITALGIVAHEVGHAVQAAESYRFMRLRTRLGGRVNQAAQWISFAFIGGMWFNIPVLMLFSGLFLAALVLFTLVTLPVERDASKRALTLLQQAGLADSKESRGVHEVLNAAAFTYLSALGQCLGTFVFFVAMVLTVRSSGA